MNRKSDVQIVVTGSSGMVGSQLCDRLKAKYSVIGIDRAPGRNTEIVSDLASPHLQSKMRAKILMPICVINCAAAKNDFGLVARSYKADNVLAHVAFLRTLEVFDVLKFIHISSVAAIDGELLAFDDNLGCDDAYRSTKYEQEIVIVGWCRKHDIELSTLLPSAIYGDTAHGNNIDALFYVANRFPIVPKIDSKKSSTFLGNFVEFIEKIIEIQGFSRRYLCIERPVLSVFEYFRICNKNILIINIPFFQTMCFVAIKFIDLFVPSSLNYRLNPPRLAKLFSDTNYQVISDDIDTLSYNTKQKTTQIAAIQRIAQSR